MRCKQIHLTLVRHNQNKKNLKKIYDFVGSTTIKQDILGLDEKFNFFHLSNDKKKKMSLVLYDGLVFSVLKTIMFSLYLIDKLFFFANGRH